MRKKFKNYSDFIEYLRYLFRIWHYERLVVEL